MPAARPAVLLERFRNLIIRKASAGVSDRELVRRFAQGRDEAAFTALLDRHGAMVLGVCRRVLGHAQDAEDAFQATFLVLARKAGSIRSRDSAAAWLYGVARRVSLKARTEAARRQTREGQTGEVRTAADPMHEITLREAQALLDEELGRLPDPYRAPLVLCYLEGATQDLAARRLGWSLRTLRRRLGRGRELLRVRLARSGLALSAVLATTLLDPPTVSAGLTGEALRAAVGQVGPVSAHVADLAEGVLGSSFATTGRAAFLGLTLGLVLAGAGLAAHKGLQTEPPPPTPEAAAPADAAGRAEPRLSSKARKDQYGDPLPPGAVARLGTIRLRPGGRVEYLAFSPDGKRLASWSEAGFSLWEVATGRELRHVERPGEALAFTWLADGRGRAVFQVGNANFFVWEFTDLKIPPPPRPPFVGGVMVMKAGDDLGNYDRFAVSPDGKYLAAGSSGFQDRDRPVHVWPLATGRKVSELQGLGRLGFQGGTAAALPSPQTVGPSWSLAASAPRRSAPWPSGKWPAVENAPR
jgi:RNA polymerase sigma factor (sigma-70 family)